MSDDQIVCPRREMHPTAIRAAIRSGAWRGPTAHLAPGYVQANLVVLPADEAAAFQLFCERNPQACPLLAVLPPGDPHVPRSLAADADVRFDIPRYRVYHEGQFVAEVEDLSDLWRDDLIAFLLGCSFGFDGALLAAGLPVRHVEQGRNVPMFRTTRPCVPAGPFRGNLVVTYRPMPATLVAQAAAISARYPLLHGAPIQIGDPESLGIADLKQPDWGEPVVALPGDVPMFWACGVTPQAVALQSRIPLMITHAPGHMLVADVPVSALAAPHPLPPVQL
jgi:uncharacterized protein YcsI (UPF0317 family)